MSWALTVAAIIEREGCYLLVEETDSASTERVFNQPAGHVEPGESLLDAVRREVKEETGLVFTATGVVGIYQLRARNGKDYCRVCFTGTVPSEAQARPEDPDILGCRWVPFEAVDRLPLRSGLVRRCFDDYRSRPPLPLGAISPLLAER